MPNLKPCSFCGDTQPAITRLDEVFRAVVCDACGARGPMCGTEEADREFGCDYVQAAKRDAIAAWNDANARDRRVEDGR